MKDFSPTRAALEGKRTSEGVQGEMRGGGKGGRKRRENSGKKKNSWNIKDT